MHTTTTTEREPEGNPMFTPSKLTRAVTFATALLGGTGLARAQMLEEITVTAQKREQSMQDVGISVTSYSGDQMKALGVTNTVEISDQVPGLAMISFSPVRKRIGVSGIFFTDSMAFVFSATIKTPV